MPTVLIGTLVRYQPDRGFGFLERDDGQPEVFCHKKCLTDGVLSWPKLKDGIKAEFIFGIDHVTGKPKAIEWTVLGGGGAGAVAGPEGVPDYGGMAAASFSASNQPAPATARAGPYDGGQSWDSKGMGKDNGKGSPADSSKGWQGDGGKGWQADSGKGWQADGGKGWQGDGGNAWQADGGKGWQGDGGKGWTADGGKGWTGDGGKGWAADGGKGWTGDGGNGWAADGGKGWAGDGGKGWGGDGGKGW